MTTRTTKRDAGTPTWFDLMTSDIDAAKTFYAEILGWNYLDTGADFGHYNLAVSQGHNAAGMGPIPPGAEMPSAWTVYFASDDASADAERVKTLGGQVMSEHTVGDLGKMAICTDPTGAAFGLWQAINHIGAGVENEPGGMCWCEVNTRDSAAALDFYTKLLTLTPTKMEGMEYHILQRGEEMLCGIMQMDDDWEGVPSHWLGYFAIDNTDEAVERAATVGGKVQVPAFDMEYGRTAVLSDPAGANFGIVQA
ncbi:MAG: VOC family protein [Chloroflexota bacterium]